MGVSVLRVGYKAVKGLGRAQYEDSLRILQPKTRQQMAQYGSVFVVADGVGGKPLAAEASARVTMAVVERYYNAPSPRVTFRLVGAFRAAHMDIVRASQEKHLPRPMNSTAVAAVVRDSRVWVANVGNSRCYLAHRAKVRLLTQDHTFVAEGVRRKVFSWAEAARHPMRAYLTQTLGATKAPIPSFARATLKEGDALLLCTDGLSDFVSETEVAHALLALPPQAAAQHLVNLAVRRGTRDDCTALVVKAVPYTPVARQDYRMIPVASAGSGADFPAVVGGLLLSLSIISMLVLALLV